MVSTRRVLGLSMFLVLGILLLPSLSSAQVVSNDPNFTPSILKPGLSFPDGVVFRPPTGDLLVTQSGNNMVTSINPNSGMPHAFATTSASPDKIAVRASDGLVAVLTGPFGPVAFFSANGTSQGTVDLGAAIILAFPDSFTGFTVACVSGLSFDTSGNLFVAAGPGSTESNGCVLGKTWSVYKFAGLPATATPTHVTTFPESVVIQDMVFSAAPPPLGTLYAIDSEGGRVLEIPLFCGECTPFASTIATVPTALNPRGIAVDPLLGDIYISEFAGTEILRIPAPGAPSDPTAITFATGFSSNEAGDTLRLAFDTNGNLYVNEIGAGNLWKFTRASNATTLRPLTQGVINTFTFINPNPAMSDQIQTMLIPASAKLNGAAFIQDIFVSVDPATLNTTLHNGTTGDITFFGGAPVPAGTTCALVPSASPNPLNPTNCVVVIQKCYDVNQNPFEICLVQEPSNSTDLIQLTFTYTGANSLANPAFLIGFDNGDGTDITDITIADCCSGGTKSLCSKTFDASLPANSADFALAISPDPVDLTVSNPNSATVTVTSINGFASTIALGLSDVPAGFTASLNPTSVSLPASSTAPSLLTVGISSSATTSGMANLVANLLAAGCIDNAGIANALTSKLSTAQANISSGHIQTAINVLMAFRDQVQAQSGKHIAASCTTTFPLIVEGSAGDEVHSASTNITFTPATVITSNVVGLITSLKASASSADPITGFVTDSTGNGVQNVVVNILNSSSAEVATATTDITGFYFFATTSTLNVGASYTIQVNIASIPPQFSTASPTYPAFTWAGKGLAFNFTLQ